MGYVDSIVKRIQQDIKKYGENRKTVRAGIIDVLTVRYLSPEQMHVNPDDEFSDPKVGPSEEIVERYIDEARSDLEAGKKSCRSYPGEGRDRQSRLGESCRLLRVNRSEDCAVIRRPNSAI